ncbi:hypothetical protein [uncultured Deinococcus sp.]|uniref:hypothetical protein n=1 Tax=uncultured Deinococcus sp. TaxID=158789 RepID=UPI0025F885AD|nr:hypothetical protein [uncultured Deinococcus sp.]
MRPSENVKRLLANLGAEVYAELSGDNSAWQAPILRAVTETAVQPWMIFTIVGPLDEDTHRADLGITAQVACLVFVNVAFEISESDEHYLSVFDARVAAVRAIQRVLRDTPASLTPYWRGEEEAELNGATISQSKIVIAWDEPA